MYLLHTSKRRAGADQSQLLYWFRTPPHVKIGRAAFDEDAIRMLEEQHPNVEFEWDRILTTKAPAAPEPRDSRDTRPARRPDRRPVRDSRRDPPPSVPAPVAAPAIELEAPNTATWPLSAPPREVAPPPVDTPVVPLELPPPIVAVSPAEPPVRRFVRVFDAPGDAAPAPTHHATEPSVGERMLGAELLTVLRARHAEILARISARGGEPARLEALREQAASVDPDTWVTESEVTAGLATIDATLAELHRIVGRRRRRRRRRRDGAPLQGTAPTGSSDETSSVPPDNVDDHDDAESDPAGDGPADD